MYIPPTCIIWSSFFTASLLGPFVGITPLSPLPSSPSLDPGILGPSSLGLFVRDGFVRGDEAGDAVTGDGRGC